MTEYVRVEAKKRDFRIKADMPQRAGNGVDLTISYYLTDESGNYLTDESGNRLIADVIISNAFLSTIQAKKRNLVVRAEVNNA